MSNSCQKEESVPPHQEISGVSNPTPIPRWHTAINVMYNEQVHAVQFETLAEIRTIAERIGELLVRSGIHVTRPCDIFEVQARITFFMQPLPLLAINSDSVEVANDSELDHPRRFGYL